MNTARPHRRALALALAAGLVLAGCGDDDDGGDAAASTTSTTADETSETSGPTSTVPASADPARKSQAEAAVLKQEDFPEGWDEHDPAAGLALEQSWNDLLDCLGVAPSGQALGIAVSATYLQGIGTQARSTVEYRPEDQTKPIAAALAGPGFNRCVTEVITADAARSAPEGGVPGPVSAAPLDFPVLGTSTSASRMSFSMKVGELEIPINQDLIVVFDGGSVSRLAFLNPGGPFPPSLQRTLVEAVVGRA